MQHTCLPAALILFCAIGAQPALAAAERDPREFQARIDELRAAQLRLAEQLRDTESALRELEAALAVSKTVSPRATVAPRLAVSGDLRIRAQGEYSDEDAPHRSSGRLRGRLAATYAVTPSLGVGARLVTGDADDPNSSDTLLSNFDDDVQVNLDTLYVQWNLGDLRLTGGKIPQPFVRTDLVWDSDVNPQGVSAVYRKALEGGAVLRASGLFFIIDEQVAGPESSMRGMQFGYDSGARGSFRFDANAAYLDYRLHSVAGADSGDFRTNLRDPSGRYLSDFNLGDLILGATWSGLGARWPMRFVGDLVRNFGAATSADSGLGVDLSLGRTSSSGDWRIGYGYAMAEADAVLAAFSQDSLLIATNYRMHSLSLDYTPLPGTTLTANWYHYRPYDALMAAPRGAHDWLDRLRLSLTVNF